MSNIYSVFETVFEFKVPDFTCFFENFISFFGFCAIIFFLNADKHSTASSARSTKRRVRGMLMSVGVESSH